MQIFLRTPSHPNRWYAWCVISTTMAAFCGFHSARRVTPNDDFRFPDPLREILLLHAKGTSPRTRSLLVPLAIHFIPATSSAIGSSSCVSSSDPNRLSAQSSRSKTPRSARWMLERPRNTSPPPSDTPPSPPPRGTMQTPALLRMLVCAEWPILLRNPHQRSHHVERLATLLQTSLPRRTAALTARQN